MKSVPFKTSDHLKKRKDILAYLNAALDDGEPTVFLEALRNVAQAKVAGFDPGSFFDNNSAS
jgi:DNA-binding phage protein